jgi:hypothetical protein
MRVIIANIAHKKSREMAAVPFPIRNRLRRLKKSAGSPPALQTPFINDQLLSNPLAKIRSSTTTCALVAAVL